MSTEKNETPTPTQKEITLEREALEYHAQGKPGKIEVISSKPCSTEKDLSLAYSPGVAAPCKIIAKDPRQHRSWREDRAEEHPRRQA